MEDTAQLFGGGFAIHGTTILAFLVAMRDQITAVVPHGIGEPREHKPVEYPVPEQLDHVPTHAVDAGPALLDPAGEVGPGDDPGRPPPLRDVRSYALRQRGRR